MAEAEAVVGAGRRRGRWKLPVAFVLVAVGASGATWFWEQLMAGIQSRPLPPLLQNAPKPQNILDNEAGARFTTYLLQQFPIGSSEMDLIDELWRDGFVPGGYDGKGRDEATFIDYGICRLDSQVSWDADQKGRLTKVSGWAAYTCL